MSTDPVRSQAAEAGQIVGTAAGVPFVAVPPTSEPTASTPVVVAWHLLDAPRTEAAFAAALPLDGLDVWRIYFGLPMNGSRMPAGGFDEIMRLGSEDVVLNLYGPIWQQAAEEFPAAYAELRERLGIGSGPIGLLGGSMGASVAMNVLADRPVEVAAAVLVSPMVQLSPIVAAGEEMFGVAYEWSDQSSAIAERMDFVARAEDLTRGEPAVELIVGAADDKDGVQRPAAELRDKLATIYDDADRVGLVSIDGMQHALADEPGVEPAPQLPHAAEVDRHAVLWFQEHLVSAPTD